MAGHGRKHPPIPVIVVLVLALAGGGWWWWRTAHPSAEAASTALNGQVEARQYDISSAIAGRVLTVPVAEGDQVTKGQPIVTLDTAALDLQLKQAQQGVIAAQAAVTNAKDSGTKADVTAAEARVEQATAAVSLAQVQLGYASVTAPRDGRVVTVVTNVGQNAAPGRILASIVDLHDLFVRVYVPETRIGTVSVGQAVSVSSDSGGAAIAGTVSFVSAQAEFTPNTVQTAEQRAKLVYEVRVTISDSSGTLKPGMPVDVTLR
ncbi:MAG TPA: efflux RND transporter periplasmic adaptor subunit [Dermatophilaceae bacterium]|jgi:HlyD family secretion protein|nr:efflux RND transporter periplasmic adaptor subunit [Dermatophilaceae bacterium]HQH89267.1 efflux RND transporter periplasmic adaptor subunit [Dermatophilaceae bacterium]HQK61199.1 efflux RND transporter periplasmic adaptor subunit [Dermatophilaceae bacterium]